MECERCSHEATFRITWAGPDAAKAHRRLCPVHATEELQQHADPPEGKPANVDGVVDVYVSKVVLQFEHEQQFVFLTELGSARQIPICMGAADAQAVERRLLNTATPRPTTHQVVAGVMAALGGTLRDALIHKIEDHSYHAVLRIERGDALHEVDARPSDAVAVALLLESPIRVRESVLAFVNPPQA